MIVVSVLNYVFIRMYMRVVCKYTYSACMYFLICIYILHVLLVFFTLRPPSIKYIALSALNWAGAVGGSRGAVQPRDSCGPSAFGGAWGADSLPPPTIH